jgi:hypothetical protein
MEGFAMIRMNQMAVLTCSQCGAFIYRQADELIGADGNELDADALCFRCLSERDLVEDEASQLAD